MNKKIILLLSEARTGSNLLNEALNLYTPVRTINEFYLSKNGFYITPDKTPDDLPHKTLIGPKERSILAEFLNVPPENYYELISAIRNNPIESLFKLAEVVPQHLVVKIHKEHFDELNLVRLLDNPNVEVMLLERTSRLHSYVSNLKARQYDKWHNVDTSDIRVTVNISDFLQQQQKSLDWYIKIREILKNYNKQYLEVNYERDLEHITKESFYALCDPWLKLVDFSLSKSTYELKYFKKQNNSSIENSIENYSEVVKVVNKSAV